MTEISDSSKKIDNIVKVINDISFQTNLLALNAAVEAARAGEAGRGFAVVASEVRNLAQKTADSSKTIKQIVSQNVESTQKGMELIKQTSEFFETILQTLQHMSEQIQQIASGAAEQTTGVEQINISIQQIEGIVNHNAGLVDRFESVGKSLKTSSSELMEMVDHFRTDDDGKTKPGKKAEKKIEKKPEKKPAARPVAPAPTPKQQAKQQPKKQPKQEPKQQPKQETQEDDFFASDEGDFEEF